MFTFGEKIAALRKEKKLSQQAVAEKLGTQAPVVTRYEKNKIKPSIEVAKKIADIYDVSLDYLVSENNKQIKDKKMVNRVLDLESLNPKDKEYIVFTIDALLRDAKTRKAYS